ncbi:MAG: hypothetical protein AB7G06_02990 [Bdellovibrionales bacterium]
MSDKKPFTKPETWWLQPAIVADIYQLGRQIADACNGKTVVGLGQSAFWAVIMASEICRHENRTPINYVFVPLSGNAVTPTKDSTPADRRFELSSDYKAAAVQALGNLLASHCNNNAVIIDALITGKGMATAMLALGGLPATFLSFQNADAQQAIKFTLPDGHTNTVNVFGVPEVAFNCLTESDKAVGESSDRVITSMPVEKWGTPAGNINLTTGTPGQIFSAFQIFVKTQ